MSSDLFSHSRQINALLGIKIHFRYGAHVLFPKCGRVFHLRVLSLSTGDVVFDNDIPCHPDQSVEFKSLQMFFVSWKIEISEAGHHVFVHQLNISGKPVCLDMSSASLADCIAWLPACANFQTYWNCLTTVAMPEPFIELFQNAYPTLRFIPAHGFSPSDFLAIYPLSRPNPDIPGMPLELQNTIPIPALAKFLLNIPSPLPQTQLAIPEQLKPQCTDKYICISTQASAWKHLWTYPDGWSMLAEELKKRGYRVICLDTEHADCPEGTEPYTGSRTLPALAAILRNATCFIGLPSDMSWLAWACTVPVILIAGNTAPQNDTPTPYRVSVADVCHHCATLPPADTVDDAQCPENLDFICTKSISPDMIMKQLDSLEASTPQNASQTLPYSSTAKENTVQNRS